MKNVHLAKEFKAVKSDASNLLSDFADVVGTLIDMGKTEASDKRDQIEHELRVRLDQIRSGVQTAQKKGTEALDSIEDKVRTHPLGSVLAAFGIGFLLGKIFDRK